MCNSMIFTNNGTAVTLASGSIIPLGSVSRKFGCNLALLGNNIIINGKGYYDVKATITFTPSAADTYTVQLFKGGVAVQGATAVITTDETTTIPLIGVVRSACCDVDSKLEFRITSLLGTTTADVTNFSVIVEKI